MSKTQRGPAKKKAAPKKKNAAGSSKSVKSLTKFKFDPPSGGQVTSYNVTYGPGTNAVTCTVIANSTQFTPDHVSASNIDLVLTLLGNPNCFYDSNTNLFTVQK